MESKAGALVLGVLMVVGGLATYVAFHDVETPVVGLRQVGLVVAVLGVVELVAAAWATLRARRSDEA